MSKEINYEIGRTGRVKAAGVPFDVMANPASQFKQNPGITLSAEMTEHYTRLRQAPSDEIRDRFFPRDRANKNMFRNSSLLTRPIFKTDQGAGQFLSFEVNGASLGRLSYEITDEQGFCLPEAFFLEQLIALNYPELVVSAINEVETYFGALDFREAQLAYERLQIAAESAGMTTTREAQVGREALFFIRPTAAEKPVTIPTAAYRSIKETVSRESAQFADRAQAARERFAFEQHVPLTPGRFFAPIYFQTDVQLTPDGSAIIDQIHLPDLGLFMTAVDPKGNAPLCRVQESVGPLKDQVVTAIEAVVKKRHQCDQVYLITRPEVLSNNEDVLENLEISVLTQELAMRGIRATAIGIDNAAMIDAKDIGILLNVDVTAESYTQFLRQRLSDDRAAIYPDPFLRLAMETFSGYTRVQLQSEQVASLNALVKSIDVKNVEQTFGAAMAVDHFLARLGIQDDVFHVHIASQRTPIACYRYDVRGIQIALSAIQPGEPVSIRSIPIAEDSAVLFKDKRPIYTVFRTMAIEEGI